MSAARELLVHNLGELATPSGSSPRLGRKQGQILRQAGLEVVCRDGRIVFVGPGAERERAWGPLPNAQRLDGRGGTLIPGIEDAHTHLPWAGSREHEFAMRLAGRSYQEIAAAGGGILATVKATREANEGELAAAAAGRLDRMLAWGTTTAEA